MEIKNTFRKEESRVTVVHDEIEYTREEVIMNGNFHTINWHMGNRFDESYYLVDYYSGNNGWSDTTEDLNHNAPVPEIELLYQATLAI